MPDVICNSPPLQYLYQADVLHLLPALFGEVCVPQAVVVELEEGIPFFMEPSEFVLASTLEDITLPDDIVGRLEGKSSLARIGLLMHSTAGYVDPGWHGHLTMQLTNVSRFPVSLYYGMKIGQLSLLRLTTPAERLYGDKRLGSNGGFTPRRDLRQYLAPVCSWDLVPGSASASDSMGPKRARRLSRVPGSAATTPQLGTPDTLYAPFGRGDCPECPGLGRDLGAFRAHLSRQTKPRPRENTLYPQLGR